MSDVVIAREASLSAEDYIEVVGNSALGAVRPLADRNRVERMLAGANLLITARLDGRCVGVARGLSDFSWVCYLGDLAVKTGFQGRGIGRRLLLACRDLLGDDVAITLFSAPEAKPFYDSVGPEIGLRPNPDGYYWPRRRGA